MSDPKLTVYGAPWCPDCKRSKKFLTEQLVMYNWVDIDESETGRAFVEQINGGKRIIPTIVFEDGSFLVEPSNAELAAKLNLQTKPQRNVYDLVIIGGGPTGLTAAIYAAREGLDTLIIERSALGGQASTTAELANFPGFPDGLSGTEFSERVVTQARRFGVEILLAQEVAKIVPDDIGAKGIILGDGTEICAQAVLIATGASYRRLGVPGEEDYLGAGVHFCATCDGPFYKGRERIAVIGGGNSATEEALHLLKFVPNIEILARGPELTASKTAIEKITTTPGITVHYNAKVTGLQGADSKLTTINWEDASGTAHALATPAAFVFIGQKPNTAFLNGLVKTDATGFILTGHDLVHGQPAPDRMPFQHESSIAGVFAAGDCRAGSTKQVASAVGEGASAAIAIREYLKTV